MNNSSSYKVIEILKMSTDYLATKGIENARLNSELLLGHVLKMNRVQLYLNFEKPLTVPELDLFRAFLKRRANHEPIQYILEETEFYSLKLKLNRHTLIPRPETEILVDTVIDNCKKFEDQEKTIRILDIGTGSGNIAISLAKNLKRAFITAIDIQNEALQIAKINAEYHQVDHKIEFLKRDIFTENLDFSCIFHVIVSNPPYISKHEFEALPKEVKDYEPYIALNGGPDGLTFHRRLAQLSKQFLMSDGIIAIEIETFQSDKVKQLFSETELFRQIEIIKDLNGLPRVLLAKVVSKK